MKRFLKVLFGLVVVLVVAGGALWTIAPHEVWPVAAQVAQVVPGEDLDAWLAAREGVFDDITPGAEKHIFWAGEAGTRTPLVLVYLHGFSATRQEITPVTETLARALGANLFATRFAGHGRSGAALAEASAADWATDLSEAMAVARRLGERVVLVGTSTGGSIATLAALDPAYRDHIAGLVLISPNFAVNSSQAWMLDLPYARWWVPLVVGETRSWEPINADQARFWTSSYPSVAVFAMRTIQRAAQAADHRAARAPALVFYAPGDQVVLPTATEAVIARWGAPVEAHVVTNAEDPSQHVIAGDIVSPTATPAIIAAALSWLRAL